MREIASALLRSWWQTPLLLAEQITATVVPSAIGEGPDGQSPSVRAPRQIGRLGKAFRRFVDLAEEVQRRTLDMTFDAATLKPFRDSVLDEFPTLRASPRAGSRSQPELEYLRALNETDPAGQSVIILILATLYSNLSRYAEGVEAFEGFLAKHRARMEPWQRAVYLSSLALLRARAAGATPPWNLLSTIRLAGQTLAAVDEAKELTRAEPDAGEQNSKLIARWVSGLLNAQLPPPSETCGREPTIFNGWWTPLPRHRSRGRRASCFSPRPISNSRGSGSTSAGNESRGSISA
jgi:hypothetical protein